MAPIGLYEALVGGYGDDNYYLGQDPYFNAGRSVMGWQMPRAETNSQAVFGPLLQGLLAGGLTAYGRDNARQAAYQDYANNPLLSAVYGRPDDAAYGPLTEEDALAVQVAPEGWTAKQGRQDLLMAVMQKQAQDDAAAKAAEIRAKLALEFSPEMIGLEAFKAGEIERAKAESTGLPGIPKPLQPQALEEGQAKASDKASLEYVDDQFDKAIELGGKSGAGRLMGALGLGTLQSSAGSSLASIGAGLQGLVQKKLGAEPSDKFRARIDATLPDWNDSTADIERKRQDFKDILGGLSKPTPILDELQGKSTPTKETDGPPSPPPGYELTGNRDANGNWGIRKIK